LPKLFFSYSHVDEGLRDKLETHLSILKRQRIIDVWHDRRILAGNNFSSSISDELEEADIVLLLVSPDFLASDYCYNVEMTRALERHQTGACTVIPVILRHCDWRGTPFGGLLAIPRDGKPVLSFTDLDEAFLEITNSIKMVAEKGPKSTAKKAIVRASDRLSSAPHPLGPRSSDLRIKKIFSDQEKDRFREEAFDYIAKYFENSLSELCARNQDIEFQFKRIDKDQFTSTIYRKGSKASYCRIFIGSASFLAGIAYSSSESLSETAFNESLSVSADDQTLFLRPLGMALHGSNNQKLTLEGAASSYWSIFIEPLRR
jgi:hypothetical protein